MYVTTARKANKCAGAVLITVCWDEAEAEKCRRVIRTGHPGFIFVPIVIDRRTVPDLVWGSPYLVLLTAIIGGIDLETDSGARTAVQAITGSGEARAKAQAILKVLDARGLNLKRGIAVA